MSIYTKLLEVQKEIGAISKDSKNPFFSSKYFDINKLIEHVNPILSENGLLLLQPIREGKQYSLIIDAETGEQVESYLELPKENNPQKMGSVLTYFRRYMLCNLIGLQSQDDDDGNKATQEANKPVDYKKKLNNCNTLDELKTVFTSFPKEKQAAFTLLKDTLKLELK